MQHILCLDLLVGCGKNHVPNLERRIHEERCKYLVAEMKCKVLQKLQIANS